MTKKNKVIESTIQPNPKEVGIWSIPKQDGSRELKAYNNATGKWEGGSSSADSGNSSADTGMYTGIRICEIDISDEIDNPVIVYTEYEKPLSFEMAIEKYAFITPDFKNFTISDNNFVLYAGYALFHEIEQNGWLSEGVNPVKATDLIESKNYYTVRVGGAVE